MRDTLRNKKILVTAGPTWVAIDAVRVISNTSSGRTGMAIARRASEMGADVTLLLGPCPSCHSEPRGGPRLEIIRFKYFDELRKLLSNQLKKKKYDILIHAAAVSDYRPSGILREKIKSGRRDLRIVLKPTIKLIDGIRKAAAGAFLVMFKLEAGKQKRQLIEIAYNSMLGAGADLVVANNVGEVGENTHKACLIDRQKNVISVKTKRELVNGLFTIISKNQTRDRAFRQLG